MLLSITIQILGGNIAAEESLGVALITQIPRGDEAVEEALGVSLDHHKFLERMKL